MRTPERNKNREGRLTKGQLGEEKMHMLLGCLGASWWAPSRGTRFARSWYSVHEGIELVPGCKVTAVQVLVGDIWSP